MQAGGDGGEISQKVTPEQFRSPNANTGEQRKSIMELFNNSAVPQYSTKSSPEFPWIVWKTITGVLWGLMSDRLQSFFRREPVLEGVQ